MRRFIPLILLASAGCGEAVEDNHFAQDIKQERPEPAAVQTNAVPVRIGELGANFAACNAAGETRNLAEGASLAVRAAPFETAAETGQVPAGRDFHICSRSHDQKWFGIVYPDEAGQGCGVSTPVSSERDYAGPCRSGWVSSALVRLTAGIGKPRNPPA